jgi:outer membrane protein OmpA-like peptidoglycan-associated protein
MQNFSKLIFVSLTALGMVGCASQPPQNTALDSARALYASAKNDTNVTKYGAVELQKADDNLRLAEQALQDNTRRGSVDHYAYLAQQHIALAQELAKTASAEDSIQQMSAQRDQVLLNARVREAERAKANAEAQARQNEIAQRQALSAAERARMLEMQLAELQAKSTNRGLVVMLQDNMLFDNGSAQLKPGSARNIDKLVTFLNDFPQRTLLIEGHTDNVGSTQFNRELSEQRAEAVRQALVSRGINSNRIQIRGYGEAYPLVSNNTAAGRQQNRRVEIVISDDSGNVATR